MSLTIPIRTEKPTLLYKRMRPSTSVATTVPSLVRGAVSETAAASRREVLQEFHSFEMMADADGHLQSDAGLVFSDGDGSFTAGHDHDDVDDETAEREFQSHWKDSLHRTREELKGQTIHPDTYRINDIWREVAREEKLRGDDEALLTEKEVLTPSRLLSPPLGNAPDHDSPEAILDDLGRLKLRMERIKNRQGRRVRKAHSIIGIHEAGSGVEDSSSSAGESDFDPDRYVAPILHGSAAARGNDVLLLEAQQRGTSSDNLRDIFPDSESVKEAMRLLDYSVQSDRPDVVACIHRCQEAQRIHCPKNEIPVFTGKKGSAVRGEAAPPVVSPPPRAAKAKPPSVEELARLVAGSLPTIPRELIEELQDQRRLLERLSAAQEESLRRHSKEQQEAARRRLMAPRPDPLFNLYVPEAMQVPELHHTTGMVQRTEQQQHQQLRRSPQRSIPPVITIMSNQPEPPIPPPRPIPPPHVIKEELQRVHQQYERILRDERRAWTELVQNQKDAFEREKKAAAEAMHNFTMNQQRVNAEETKRIIAAQEVRQQRMQHASQLQQQRAMQQMVSKVLCETGTRTPVSKVSPFQGRNQPSKARRGGLPARKVGRRQPPEKSVARNKPGTSAEPSGGEGAQSTTKGPFKVVLLPGEGEGATTTSPSPSPQAGGKARTEEVVVLSDDEGGEAAKDFCDPESGKRGSVSKDRRASGSLPASAKMRGVAVKRGSGLSSGGTAKGRATSASQSKRNSAASPRGNGSQPSLSATQENIGSVVPSYAFDVKNAQINRARGFENTEEIALASSFPSFRDDLPDTVRLEGGLTRTFEDAAAAAAIGDSRGCGRREAEAMFMRSVVLLGDNLTPDELARKRMVQNAFDVNLHVPPPTNNVEGGLERPCDAYFYGVERDELTPRRRAELRAVEAQSLLEARRRLERIKELSIGGNKRKFGEPSTSFEEGVGERFERRLCELISSDVIRCVIEEGVEGDLFGELMQLLESDIVRAEIHRILENDRAASDEEPGDITQLQMAETVKGLRNRYGSFGAPAFESVSREETLLHHIQEELVRVIADAVEGAEKDSVEEECGIRNDESAQEGKAEATPSVGSPSLHSAHAQLEGVMTQESPQWVHEIIRAGDDPLRSPSAEIETTSAHLQPQLKQQQDVGGVTGGDFVTPSAATLSNVAVAVEGAIGDPAVISDGAVGGNTIRIVLDVAPVTQLLTTARLLPQAAEQLHEGMQQWRQMTEGPGPMTEDPRLPCSTEETLPRLELPDLQSSGLGGTVTQVAVLDVPPLRQEIPAPNVPEETVPPLPLLLPISSVPPHLPVSGEPQLVHRAIHEEQLAEARRLCEEGEYHRRQLVCEQEEMMRYSFVMMWDWEHEHIVRVEREKKQQQHILESMLNERLAAQRQSPVMSEVVRHTRVERSHSLPAAPADVSYASAGDDPAKAAPSTGIRDPITKFIFEWMREFDPRKTEKTFGEKLREASMAAEGRQPTYPKQRVGIAVTDGRATATTDDDDEDSTEPVERDVRRRLLMEIDAADSSSWLSSAHTSSLTEGGTPQFTRRRGTVPTANVAAAARPIVSLLGEGCCDVYRHFHNAEGSSSKTTETTRYSSSFHLEQEPVSKQHRHHMPKPSSPAGTSTTKTESTSTSANTAKTTKLTSSGSGSEHLEDTAPATHLHETLRRHLNYEQPLDHRRDYVPEDLRKRPAKRK
ncbi:hypothetical protein, conserved [Trypanosoma brucei brucei TREU927]|uniref:Uncharacterized protein n=1 Tax=Trypanosoma brucei brucei (strain 927/4 GUTat10.1) TaxID=185431 RepID=Q582Y5_TRYB2|nr:hypothetical protein, conserved [Trypanosoma brucei brucei TREU927]AAX80704.1 hypothetical protein, conserved [Trypanosoma brucei]AAZ10307.1 hypothetical protein, conserved [Trypanosoma brucei brucei TREU927]